MATTDETRTEASSSNLVNLLQWLNPKRVLLVYTILIAFYIYMPIISLVGFSFNSGGLTFPFVSVSTQWYSALLANESIISSVILSLNLALTVTAIVTPLATITALAYRYDFWGQRGLLFLLILGIITPGITYGVASTLFLNELLGLSPGPWLAVPVHTVWTLPFAVIVLLAGFPPNLAENEEAAKVMGAGRWTRFREVILPQIAPTVLGAAVFAFTLSYNEGTRGLLLLGRQNTMPVEVFAIAASRRATPELFALGSITTVGSTILLLIASYLALYR
jgi:putative spermidine/putrescine transport system permease protein